MHEMPKELTIEQCNYWEKLTTIHCRLGILYLQIHSVARSSSLNLFGSVDKSPSLVGVRPLLFKQLKSQNCLAGPREQSIA